MEPLFLGRGAGFNPMEGNTSAYFIEDKKLFLIDCGESVFGKIIELDLLKDIDEINIMITHTHSDHIGSLASLIMYCYYEKKMPVNIIKNKDLKHIPMIDMILANSGCLNGAYKYIDEEEFDNKFKLFNSIRYRETVHVKNLPCYSLTFETNQGIIYYTGDTSDINPIKELIDENKEIDKLYIDTNSLDKDNGHLYIGILDREIPYEYKNKIYCMHVNNKECIEMARGLGFNVVEVKRKEEEIEN